MPPLLIALLFGAPGLKLLALWRRTRNAPEGFLAGFFLSLAVAAPVRLYQADHPELGAGVSFAASLISLCGLPASVCFLNLFTWRVFRPSSRAARAWVRVAFFLFAMPSVYQIASGEMHNMSHPVAILGNAFAILPFSWAFIECLSFYRRMRKQAAFGIGDPVVSNRFLLWSIWTGVFVVLPFISLAMRMMLTSGELTAGSLDGASSYLGLFVAVSLVGFASIWLSFFPPAAYVARLRHSATK